MLCFQTGSTFIWGAGALGGEGVGRTCLINFCLTAIEKDALSFSAEYFSIVAGFRTSYTSPSSTHTHTHTHTHTRTHARTHTHTHTHTPTHPHARTHARTHIHTHTHTPARAHALTHTHTPTHTHREDRQQIFVSGELVTAYTYSTSP